MRKTARALVIVVVSFLGAIALGITSAFAAALAFGATALIVPGTGTPNANGVGGYLQNARDYYMTHTVCGVDGSGCPDSNLIGINYPASFWPLGFPPFSASWCPGLQCDTWDVSVQAGVDALDAAVTKALHDPTKPGQDVVIFGYSQGGAVVSNELRLLNTSLTPDEKARLQVVLIGNIDNPVGGLWSLSGSSATYPSSMSRPALSTPPDTGINYTTYYFEYDGVSNSPVAWGNLLAVANALAGFDEIHGTYLDPNQNSDFTGLPNGYTKADLLAAINDPANIKTDRYGNTYVKVPSKTLPLASLILGLADSIGLTPFVKPFVDLASPVARVLIDLAYDPNADPSVPQRLTILPIATAVDPIKLTLDLAIATVQGIQAFLGDLGVGGSTIPAPATAPESTSLLAARSLSLEPEQVEEPSVALASSKNSKPVTAAIVEKVVPVTEPVAVEPVSANTSAVDTTEPVAGAAPTDPPATKPDQPTKPKSTKSESTKPADASGKKAEKAAEKKGDGNAKKGDKTREATTGEVKKNDAGAEAKKDAA